MRAFLLLLASAFSLNAAATCALTPRGTHLYWPFQMQGMHPQEEYYNECLEHWDGFRAELAQLSAYNDQHLANHFAKVDFSVVERFQIAVYRYTPRDHAFLAELWSSYQQPAEAALFAQLDAAYMDRMLILNGEAEPARRMIAMSHELVHAQDILFNFGRYWTPDGVTLDETQSADYATFRNILFEGRAYTRECFYYNAPTGAAPRADCMSAAEIERVAQFLETDASYGFNTDGSFRRKWNFILSQDLLRRNRAGEERIEMYPIYLEYLRLL